MTEYSMTGFRLPDRCRGQASRGMTNEGKRRSRSKLKLDPLFRAVRTPKSTQIPDEPKKMNKNDRIASPGPYGGYREHSWRNLRSAMPGDRDEVI